MWKTLSLTVQIVYVLSEVSVYYLSNVPYMSYVCKTYQNKQHQILKNYLKTHASEKLEEL